MNKEKHPYELPNGEFNHDKWTKDNIAGILELDSEDINRNHTYFSQLGKVKECLGKSFGIYTQYIKITNNFLIEIDYFMTSYHIYNTYKGKKEGERWEEIQLSFQSSINAINDYVIRYGREGIKQMNKDFSNLSKEEKAKKKVAMRDNFIDLLMQNIEPVGFRKPRPKREPK